LTPTSCNRCCFLLTFLLWLDVDHAIASIMYQMAVDVQQIITALPQHLLAVLLGSLSGVLSPGRHWAESLTEVALTEAGPLEHVVRGVTTLVTLLEVLPKYRYVLYL
jgi:hypothetical protein